MRFVRAKSERLAELLAEHGQSRTLPGDFSELIGKVITEPQ
jgi:hypothetical protein